MDQNDKLPLERISKTISWIDIKTFIDNNIKDVY